MIDDIKFSLIIDNEEKTFLIIDKFSTNNKNYIIYKEENNDDLYASLYEVNDGKIKIIPIESDIDYDIVDEYLSGL